MKNTALTLYHVFLLGAISLCCPDTSFAQPRDLSVESLLNRENVGDVVIDDDRGIVYFERVRPAASAPVSQAYGHWRNDDARSHIYMVPMNRSEAASPLFEQNDEAGFIIAGSGIWSPNRTKIAMYRIKDGFFHPGFYDFSTGTAAFFGVAAPQPIQGSSFQWVDNETFAHEVETRVVPPFAHGFAGVKAESAARELGWKDQEITADTIGSGRLKQPMPQPKVNPYVIVDTETGAVTNLGASEPPMYQRDDSDRVSRSFVRTNDRTLLASSERGEVYVKDQYGVGSSLFFSSFDESKRQDVELFRFNTHLSNIAGPLQSLKLEYDVEGYGEVTSLLYLPCQNECERGVQYPLVMIPYPGTVYSPDQITTSYTVPVWSVLLGTNTVADLFVSNGYAVLLPSLPLSPEGTGEPVIWVPKSASVALDAAIETGFVDADRLAVSGHSGGGFAALVLATQMDRFGAIISLAGFSNSLSAYGQFSVGRRFEAVRYSSDIQNFTTSRRAEWNDPYGRYLVPPWDNPDTYVRNSPLLAVSSIEAPVLLLQGDLDTVVPATQAEEMFTGLTIEEKDALFVRYWGEDHILLQPQNQRDLWQRIFAFLEDNGVTPNPKPTTH